MKLKQLFLILLLCAALTPQTLKAITLENRNFFAAEDTACLSASEVKRYFADYDVDENDFPPTEPDDCDAAFWQLLQTLNFVTRLGTGDINNPSDPLKTLATHLPRTLQKIRYRAAATNDGTMATFNYDDQTLTLTPEFFKAGPLMRLAFLVHAARHLEDNHHLHQMCDHGPLQGRRSCDEVYLPNSTEANAAAVQTLAWIHYQANLARVSPVMADYAKHLANSILSLGYVQPVDYWMH
jgi:hypothetical protein